MNAMDWRVNLLTDKFQFAGLRTFTVELKIDCWEAEKDLKTTSGSDCALNALAIDDPLEYARLYLDGNLQMWVDAEDSLDIF